MAEALDDMAGNAGAVDVVNAIWLKSRTRGSCHRL